MTNRNLAALKAMAPRHPRTINGQTLHLRGVGLVKFVGRVVNYPGVADIILQKGVDVPLLLKEAPGFVVDISVDSLMEDDEIGATVVAENGEVVDEQELRAPYVTWVTNLPPSEMIELAEGVIDATMPEGYEALQKKAAPLLAKFGARIVTERAGSGKK